MNFHHCLFKILRKNKTSRRTDARMERRTDYVKTGGGRGGGDGRGRGYNYLSSYPPYTMMPLYLWFWQTIMRKEINFCFFIHFNKKDFGNNTCLRNVFINEPQHEKPNKWPVWPAETQIRLRPVWSVVTVGSVGSQEPKVSSCWQRRLWSDWADAQAKLSLRWAHM